MLILSNINSFSQVDVLTITDLCEDDTSFTIAPITPYNPNSGYCGVAIFLITPDDVSASTVDFNLQDWDGNYFYNEANLKADNGGSIQPNSLYMLYDNPCFDINNAGSTPQFLWITDDIPQSSSVINGCGYYIYYYAHDAIEVINNRGSTYNSSDPSTWMGYYYDPSDPNGLGNVPSFYTSITSKREKTIWTTSSKKIILPDPSSYQYYGYGEWSGNGVTSSGVSSKTYWAGYPDHAGLIRTITAPSGEAVLDPSAMTLGANEQLTFTYNSVYGVAGPAPCNNTTVTTHEIDIHARPEITPVLDQTCDGSTYDVTLDVDLDSYNVSVDEDGGTPFNVSATGGVVSPTTLSGTGVHQVTISGIPSGSVWTVDINDVSGISCGLVGSTGDCISVLPIELYSFTAECNKEVILLKWTTVSEVNNDYFEIQRSSDAYDWEVIGTVAGAGNSNVMKYYSFTDDNYNGEIYYYRLKQVDYNGQYSYSNLIASGCEFSLNPNPAIGTVFIISDESFQESDINVYNSIGQLVKVNLINGNMLDLSGLSKGVYIVRIKNRTKRLVVN